MMGIQTMHYACIPGVERFVAIGPICAYPKYTHVPFREDSLWDRYTAKTNAGDGLAKMSPVLAQAYRQQCGFTAIFLLPVASYGPCNNFHPADSHMVPVLIKNRFDAIENQDDTIIVRGDGSFTRDFSYGEY